MAKLLGIYKCEVCGNIVEVLYEGMGELHCCGQPMKLMQENTIDASFEKHIPVGKQEGRILTVKVGSTPHPMTEEHYIQWVEVLVGNKAYREFLKPGQEPQAIFCIDPGNEPLVLREYCNLHGLWQG
jgi:superoxide reductase